MCFFKPTTLFADWLLDYARDRIVYDCGCGDGVLLSMLVARKCKAIGVEPFWAGRVTRSAINLPVMPVTVQRCRLLRTHRGLILIARPDHSGWCEWLCHHAHPDSEVLYIGKPENTDVDLPDWGLDVVDAPECAEEVVYRVDRINRPRYDASLDVLSEVDCLGAIA